VAENFGGPVWHASGCGRTLAQSKQICVDALRGAGDASLGEWHNAGERVGIWHILRRLSDDERKQFEVPDPYDIRGTDEERSRIACVLAEAPYVQRLLA
jgi:hypothetical protein